MPKLFRSGVIYPALGVDYAFDADYRLVTSPVLSPLLLACIRLLLGFYIVFYLIFALSYESVHFPEDLEGYFSYFTHLSYVGLGAYFWASGVQTICYAFGLGYPLQRWPRILQFLHVLLFSTIITFPFVTTIVFWALLSSPSTFDTKFDAWTNISVHAMNSAFALFEIVLTHSGPMPFTHIPFCVILLGLYLGVAYITHATQGFYTYNFLDPNRQHGLLAAYIVGIAVGECVIFLFSWTICTLRERFFSKAQRAENIAEDLTEDWQEISRPGSV